MIDQSKRSQHPRLLSQSLPQAPQRPVLTAIQSGRSEVQKPGRALPMGDGLASFVELEIEARKCPSLEELRFIIVNGARKIAATDQCFLAERDTGRKWSITRASSVTNVDRHTPYVRGLEAWLNHPAHADHILRNEVRLANVDQEAKSWGLRTKPFQVPFALWVPIKRRDTSTHVCLIALKQDSWRPQHTLLMMPLADAYGHAWEALLPKAARTSSMVRSILTRNRVGLFSVALAVASAFVPVPLSVLAPAEIVAIEPTIVAAPIDGIISEVVRPPGSPVLKGDLLVRFVDVKLRNDVEIAKRNNAIAEAKYFRVIQAATSAQKDMQDIALAKSELDLAAVELAAAEDVLSRSSLRADRDGILIYTAKADWIGKPVSTGERLMEIGDVTRTQMKIELPVADALNAQLGARVALFLDGNPLGAVPGVVSHTSFRPSMTADQQLAFRVHARFSDTQSLRIGLRGIARVNGDDVPLWFYLFRRPIAALRQRIGL